MTSSRILGIGAAGALVCVMLLPAGVLAQKKGELKITTSSKEALALFEQARDRIDNVESSAAVSLLDQALQKDPEFAMAYVYRAFTGRGFNVQRQNLDKAVSLADKVSPGERHWILAAHAQADGNTAKAKEHIDELLKLYPSDKRVQSFAGNYFSFLAADLPNALEHYTKATAIDKSFAAAYNQIGYTQFRQGNYPEAEQAFKQYIMLRPANPNPYDSYAELLMKTGRHDDSIAQYQKALEKDPAFVSALAGIGNNYVLKGDFAGARESYRRQFDQAPNINGKLGALFLRTVSYVHEAKVDEALKSLEETRAVAEKENLVPNVIATHLQAAFILGETGKLAESVKHLEKASRRLEESSLPPSVKDGLRLEVMMGRGQVLIAVHEFEAARGLAEKCRAMVHSRRNPGEERDLNGLLAMLALEEGKYDQAIGHFGKADQESPYNWYYKAVALDRKGDRAAASDLFAKVAGWNQNELSYALVRARALTRMASRP